MRFEDLLKDGEITFRTRKPPFDQVYICLNRICRGWQFVNDRMQIDAEGVWDVTLMFARPRGAWIDSATGEVIRTAEEIFGVADFDTLLAGLQEADEPLIP